MPVGASVIHLLLKEQLRSVGYTPSTQATLSTQDDTPPSQGTPVPPVLFSSSISTGDICVIRSSIEGPRSYISQL